MKSDLELGQLQEGIYIALKSWYKTDEGPGPLAHLQLFRQQSSGNARETTNKILLEALEALRATRPQEADLLSRHFLDGEKMRWIARMRNIGEATAYRWQNEAIAQLALVLQSQEREAQAQQRTILVKRLERPTYTQLVGVDSHLESLLEILLVPGPPWLVAIEGLGGLGKTSLADVLLRRVIEQQLFDEIGWVSARRYDFNPGRGITPLEKPALTADHLVEKLVEQLLTGLPQPDSFSAQEALAMLAARLKQQPHLIVIDNLETVADLEALLPALHDLSNPTKFLLTSREKLAHEPGIYHFPLPQLSEVDTLQLIRYEASLSNPPYLKAASEAELKAVYRVTGGNPLAIRLVVGQTHFFALPSILADLPAARGKQVESLFTFIYRRAWERLDELARRVLLAMPLVAAGQGSLEHLADLIEIDQASLRDALAWLVTLNLVDRRGDAHDPAYTIHPLTRTFLQEQVLKWK
jgi:hypothetical protein